METPTKRYRDVARLFGEHARSQGRKASPEPATPEEISAAERALGCRFPDSYRWFQLEFGDFPDGPLDIYSVRTVEPPTMNIVGINLDARHNGYPLLPPHLIAFSDSGSDLCCFDTSALEDGECPIVWWNHAGNEAQRPERAGPSFLDWLAAEVRERAAEEKWSYLRRLASNLRAVRSFARDVLRARRK
ncbi:MAG TPA: SMI1/KNR4 family protein [Candidatus Binatia bacterium]|nr:SMI1/KNR4 family protein [Candidatus Binatia bacterium]